MTEPTRKTTFTRNAKQKQFRLLAEVVQGRVAVRISNFDLDTRRRSSIIAIEKTRVRALLLLLLFAYFVVVT